MEEKKEAIEMTPYNVATHLLSDLHQRYFDSEDPAEKAKLCNQALACMDRISKMDDTYEAQHKTELDNETKLAMNKLDNETKIEVAKIESQTKIDVENIHKTTEDEKIAVQGATALADITKAALIGLGGIALTGAAMNEERDISGYVGGKSLAFRFASDLAKRIRI